MSSSGGSPEGIILGREVMEGNQLRKERRKTTLKKWELAHILRISPSKLSELENSNNPIPPELEDKIRDEIPRQMEGYSYGTAHNIVNNLVGEGYSLATLAGISDVRRSTMRKWQLGTEQPDSDQLEVLLNLPPVRRKSLKPKRKRL